MIKHRATRADAREKGEIMCTFHVHYCGRESKCACVRVERGRLRDTSTRLTHSATPALYIYLFAPFRKQNVRTARLDELQLVVLVLARLHVPSRNRMSHRNVHRSA